VKTLAWHFHLTNRKINFRREPALKKRLPRFACADFFSGAEPRLQLFAVICFPFLYKRSTILLKIQKSKFLEKS
jgi:hypothetical protein